jgi:hypothetical protein
MSGFTPLNEEQAAMLSLIQDNLDSGQVGFGSVSHVPRATSHDDWGVSIPSVSRAKDHRQEAAAAFLKVPGAVMVAPFYDTPRNMSKMVLPGSNTLVSNKVSTVFTGVFGALVSTMKGYQGAARASGDKQACDDLERIRQKIKVMFGTNGYPVGMAARLISGKKSYRDNLPKQTFTWILQQTLKYHEYHFLHDALTPGPAGIFLLAKGLDVGPDHRSDAGAPYFMKCTPEVMVNVFVDAQRAYLAARSGSLVKFLNDNPIFSLKVLKPKMDRYTTDKFDKNIRPLFVGSAALRVLFSIVQAFMKPKLFTERSHKTMNAVGFAYQRGGAAALWKYYNDYHLSAETAPDGVVYSDDHTLMFKLSGSTYLAELDFTKHSVSQCSTFGRLHLRLVNMAAKRDGVDLFPFTEEADRAAFRELFELNCRHAYIAPVSTVNEQIMHMTHGLQDGIPGTSFFGNTATYAAFAVYDHVHAKCVRDGITDPDEFLRRSMKAVTETLGFDYDTKAIRLFKWDPEANEVPISFLKATLRRDPIYGWVPVYDHVEQLTKLVIRKTPAGKNRQLSSHDDLARLVSCAYQTAFGPEWVHKVLKVTFDFVHKGIRVGKIDPVEVPGCASFVPEITNGVMRFPPIEECKNLWSIMGAVKIDPQLASLDPRVKYTETTWGSDSDDEQEAVPPPSPKMSPSYCPQSPSNFEEGEIDVPMVDEPASAPTTARANRRKRGKYSDNEMSEEEL